MFKVMIVDDEELICDLISKTINWDELGIEMIGTANDGETAFDMILNKNPNLVITDIRMPGIDGISMIKKVRESGLECSFIVISGYQDFEYARSALKFGVEDYILKPIDEEELTNTLLRIKNNYIVQEENSLKEVHLKEQLSNSLNKLREQFLFKLFEAKVDIQSLEQVNKDYGFNFRDGIFQVIALKFDKKAIVDIDESFINIFQNKMFDNIRKCLESFCYEIHILKKNDSIIGVLNYPESNFEVLENSVKGLLSKIRDYTEVYNSFYLTIGIGSLEKELYRINSSLNKAFDSVKCRIVVGTDRVIDISKLNLKNYNTQEILTIEKEQQFVYMVEVFDYEGIKIWLKEIFYALQTKENVNPILFFVLCEKIIEVFLKTMRRLDANFDEEKISEIKVQEYIDNCKSVIELQNYTLNLINELLDSYLNSKQLHDSKPIEIVKQYIQKNYKEPISLTDVANLVFLSPVYFSMIFKKEVGMNFSDYLINYRIEVARELLKDIRFNTSEVAEMVGYKDSRYFSKLFRKVVGINPTAYRKLYN